MGKERTIMEKVCAQLSEDREGAFEEFYILTYQRIYQLILRSVGQEKKAEQLLADFYVRLYEMLGELPEHMGSEESVFLWLESLLDEFFEIQAGGEEGDQLTEKRLSEERATTLFFHIEDRLGLAERDEDEGKETATRHGMGRKLRLVSAAAVGLVVCLACFGTWKIKNMIGDWIDSMEVALEDETAVPEPEGTKKGDGDLGESLTEETEEAEGFLELGDWKAALAKDGSVVALERLEVPVSHGPVQDVDGWSYMLVRDEAFPDADEDLKDSLICRELNADTYGVIAREVTDFCVEDETLYYADESGVTAEVLGNLVWLTQETLETEIQMKDDGFYLLNALGEPETAGQVQMGGTVLRVDGGRIKYAQQPAQTAGGMTFYLANVDQDTGSELCRSNGSQAWLFQKGKLWIDSFVVVGDWVYFSAYEDRDANGMRYSTVYRAKADGSATEAVTGRFQGNITAMYYFPGEGAIYGEFKPDSYHSYYGQLVRIGLNGQMQVIDSNTARNGRSTTGNDMLELLTVKDGTIYCYWHDCSVNSSNVSILWTQPLMLGLN